MVRVIFWLQFHFADVSNERHTWFKSSGGQDSQPFVKKKGEGGGVRHLPERFHAWRSLMAV